MSWNFIAVLLGGHLIGICLQFAILQYFVRIYRKLDAKVLHHQKVIGQFHEWFKNTQDIMTKHFEAIQEQSRIIAAQIEQIEDDDDTRRERLH